MSVPDAPTNIMIFPSTTTATVFFSAPENDGGSPINVYTVFISDPNILSIDVLFDAPLEATFTGLFPGTQYTFSVVATNNKGSSDPTSTTVETLIVPTFAQVAAIFSGDPLSPLPTTSLNNISGSWSPALDNTATTTYIFTPDDGQNATTVTMTITVNTPVEEEVEVTPTFAQVAAIFSGDPLSPLPTTSLNGISGTWLPEFNNKATTTYIFTPNAFQNATTATMTIVVNAAPTKPSAPVIANVAVVYNVDGVHYDVTVTVTPPTNNGGSPIMDYTLITTKNSQPSRTSVKSSDNGFNTNTFIFDNDDSTEDNTYKLKIRANNEFGSSDESNEVTFVVPANIQAGLAYTDMISPERNILTVLAPGFKVGGNVYTHKFNLIPIGDILILDTKSVYEISFYESESNNDISLNPAVLTKVDIDIENPISTPPKAAKTSLAGILYFNSTTRLAFVTTAGQDLDAPLNHPHCYARGTLIGTSRGWVPIENLLMSDKLRTYDRIKENMFRPVHGVPIKTLVRVRDTRFKNRFGDIKFIGHFTINSMNENTAPIRITAGALGENKPERDLLVSPNHSMLVGNRLIFAKFLVNGSTIYQDMSFNKIEYFHVLSDDHYIINANGALSETLGSEEMFILETHIKEEIEVNSITEVSDIYI